MNILSKKREIIYYTTNLVYNSVGICNCLYHEKTNGIKKKDTMVLSVQFLSMKENVIHFDTHTRGATMFTVPSTRVYK